MYVKLSANIPACMHKNGINNIETLSDFTAFQHTHAIHANDRRHGIKRTRCTFNPQVSLYTLYIQDFYILGFKDFA